LLSGIGLALAAPQGKCYNVGDTVAVNEKVHGFTNGGTYFELVKP
jgi:hypothetical protein